MPDKNYWIRKYEYINGLGHLYLIADFIIQEGKLCPIATHQICINEKRDDYNHKLQLVEAGEIQIKNTSDNIDKFVEHYFDISLRDVLSNIKDGKKVTFEIESTGKEVFKELQFAPIFDELKEEVMTVKMSDSFREFLEKL